MNFGDPTWDRDGPAIGGSVVLGFVLVVAVTAGAFVWVADGGVSRANPDVRVYQHPDYEFSVAAGDTASSPVDNAVTSSVAEPASAPAPQCDIDACSQAYRSFRVSDCTFQPFEGPRRLCAR